MELHWCWWCTADDVEIVVNLERPDRFCIACPHCGATGPDADDRHHAVWYWNKGPLVSGTKRAQKEE